MSRFNRGPAASLVTLAVLRARPLATLNVLSPASVQSALSRAAVFVARSGTGVLSGTAGRSGTALAGRSGNVR